MSNVDRRENENFKHIAHFDARVPGNVAKVLEAFGNLQDNEGIADVTVELPLPGVTYEGEFYGCICIDSPCGSRITVSTKTIESSIKYANKLRKTVGLSPLGWIREIRRGYMARVLRG